MATRNSGSASGADARANYPSGRLLLPGARIRTGPPLRLSVRLADATRPGPRAPARGHLDIELVPNYCTRYCQNVRNIWKVLQDVIYLPLRSVFEGYTRIQGARRGTTFSLYGHFPYLLGPIYLRIKKTL